MTRLRTQSVAVAYWLICAFLVAATFAGIPGAARAQEDQQKANPLAAEGPKDPKAIKTFQQAVEWQKRGDKGEALDAFRKAFKQDNGQCRLCLGHAFGLAMSMGAYKDAEDVAREWLPLADSDLEKASVHYGLGASLQKQGLLDNKEKYFAESRDEFEQALALKPTLTVAQYYLGISLAYLHQDDDARAAFQHFLDQDMKSPDLHDRAERFVERIDLARARMAPPFDVTTLDGRHITMDSLAGNVVLIDFWATWCGPCGNALPHLRSIAHKFEGQPLTILSISLVSDDAKWKDFVAKNEMTWLQYRDGGYGGRIAKLFNVNAIPATFSIDADGVLEDQHVGDADIEHKLKKMIARAVEVQNKKPAASPAVQSSGGGN